MVIEQIFAVPGIGEQFVRSIFVNDYAMILGTTIFFSVFFILAYLVQDILYGIIDPADPRRRSEGVVEHGDPGPRDSRLIYSEPPD